MLQLFFFFEELLYQETSAEQHNVGSSAHASPQSDNDTDGAGSGRVRPQSRPAVHFIITCQTSGC